MKVSNNVLQQYQSTSIHKNLSIFFPELELELNNSQIYEESMYLHESIFEKRSIEFVGCISSIFMVDINGLKADIKGKRIIVTISTDDTQDEPVTLFNGIVDSAVKQSNKQIKEIVAYDELYTKGNTEVAAWYKSLTFPISLKDLRYSLFSFIGLEQEEKSLPNDDIVIKKQYAPNTLQALSVIKAICQINGAFGIMNRRGKFEYRILGKMDSYRGAYPGSLLFPGPNTFPGVRAATTGTDLAQTSFTFYKSVRYEEFEVRPVDKVTIRQSEEDEGVTFGDGENNYIIQGNMFSYGLADSVLKTVAENVYNSVQGFSYYPYTADNNGLPFVECGLDMVTYMMIDYEATFSDENTSGNVIYEKKSFPVLNRTLSGIQALRDKYSADGEEYQTEFITDLQTQIDILKKKQSSGGVSRQEMENYGYSRDEIDDMLGAGSGGGNEHLSVDTVPVNQEPNVVYFIQGVVVVE